MDYAQSISVNDLDATPKTWSRILADFVSKVRFQLFGGLIVAVFLPALLRTQFERIGDPALSYEHSLIGTLCALLLGYLVFRKTTTLPGARSLVNVVPAFLTSYAVIVTFFFFMRIEYSRSQFLISFVLVCVWFALILLFLARFRRPVFAVLPSSETERLQSYKGVRWVKLKSRKLIDRYPNMPLVVDFRSSALSPDWERIIVDEAIRGRRVLSAKELTESLIGRVQIAHLSENSFGHLAPDSLYGPAKRYIDIFSASMVIVLLWPVLLVTAAVIRLESKGPSIFKQKRMGFHGRVFTVYKFRSMRVQSETESSLHSDKTKTDDHRITPFGRLMRKTRLDELPQVLNILRGDMSWIGPRPETLRLSNWYEKEIAFYRYRHIVRPGITGWAQVKQGHVTEVEDIRLKLEYDMFYVKHFSIWLDLLIAIKTISVVLTGKGAR